MARKELVSQEESDMMRSNESTFIKDDIINSIKEEQDIELPKIQEHKKNRNIQDMSAMELKSIAYDLLFEIEDKINLKNSIDLEIQRRTKD